MPRVSLNEFSEQYVMRVKLSTSCIIYLFINKLKYKIIIYGLGFAISGIFKNILIKLFNYEKDNEHFMYRLYLCICRL